MINEKDTQLHADPLLPCTMHWYMNEAVMGSGPAIPQDAWL